MNPFSEREAEILKPLASVEVTEKEDAMFETEISEADVPGEWKLKGEVMTRSPVRLNGLGWFSNLNACISTFTYISLLFTYKYTVMYPSDVRNPNGGWCA